MSTQTKNLTQAKRWLVHLMHQTYFGTMQNLLVR